MKTITMIGWFVSLLSLTMSAQISPSSSMNSGGNTTDMLVNAYKAPVSFATTPDLSGDYFITTWKVDTPDRSVTIPTTGSGYDYSIDWGDGSTNTGINGDASHLYAAAGTYTVKIIGDFPRIFFNLSGDRSKIQTIEQWGAIAWTSMNSAFMGCFNLSNGATDVPDLSLVTDMHGAFTYAESFNGGSNMGDWDVSNVTNMYGMFGGAFRFNADIGNWDVSNVTTMKLMFSHASSFNQDIGAWNVGSVTNMDSMFRETTDFDQNLGNWNVSNVVNMKNMFKGVKLSTANYDALLNGWNSLPLKNNVKFHSGRSKYCNGETARLNMIANFNWTITDDGINCGRIGDKTALAENHSLSEITLYPNPAENWLILSNPNSIKLESASIFDLTGRLIRTFDLIGMTSGIDLDVSHLSRANYLVLITGESGQISKQMVKE